jgi:hypothetical protein
MWRLDYFLGQELPPVEHGGLSQRSLRPQQVIPFLESDPVDIPAGAVTFFRSRRLPHSGQDRVSGIRVDGSRNSAALPHSSHSNS